LLSLDSLSLLPYPSILSLTYEWRPHLDYFPRKPGRKIKI
jgi:hypothetical protein